MSNEILATRPKCVVSLLAVGWPGTPICIRKWPSCVNLRICESPGAVAADPHVALVVDRDAVVRRRPHVRLVGRRSAPRGDDVAGRIELDHRRRRHAALAQLRVRDRADFGGRVERVVAMHDEHVIAIVHADADHVAEHPVIRQRLGPLRVDLEARRRARRAARACLERALSDRRARRSRSRAPRSERRILVRRHGLALPTWPRRARPEHGLRSASPRQFP